MHRSPPPRLGVNSSIPHTGSDEPAGSQPRLQLAKLIRSSVARQAVAASCRADTSGRACQRSAVVGWPAAGPPVGPQGPAERSKEKWWASQGLCGGEGREGAGLGWGKVSCLLWLGLAAPDTQAELGRQRCWISPKMQPWIWGVPRHILTNSMS